MPRLVSQPVPRPAELLQVWKYEIEILGKNQEVEMPVGATILHVDSQRTDTICLWALVCPTAPTNVRVFDVYGTGHDINIRHHDINHLGTVIIGVFVWHVFERTLAVEKD